MRRHIGWFHWSGITISKHHYWALHSHVSEATRTPNRVPTYLWVLTLAVVTSPISGSNWSSAYCHSLLTEGLSQRSPSILVLDSLHSSIYSFTPLVKRSWLDKYRLILMAELDQHLMIHLVCRHFRKIFYLTILTDANSGQYFKSSALVLYLGQFVRNTNCSCIFFSTTRGEFRSTKTGKMPGFLTFMLLLSMT